MKKTLALLHFSLLLVLVACAPAETGLDLPARNLEPSATPAEMLVPPSPTPLPTQPAQVRPTKTQPPAPTPTRLELEIEADTPTKSSPTMENHPMLPGSTAVPPTDSRSLELIDRAKTDLSQRTGIVADEIGLTEFRYVTWPDASVGCPEPGMFYADVLVDGYLIVLRAGSKVYNYHGASDDSGPFLCEGIGSKIDVPPPFESLDK